MVCIFVGYLSFRSNTERVIKDQHEKISQLEIDVADIQRDLNKLEVRYDKMVLELHKASQPHLLLS